MGISYSQQGINEMQLTILYQPSNATKCYTNSKALPLLQCWLSNYWLCVWMLKLGGLQVRISQKLLMFRILEN